MVVLRNLHAKYIAGKGEDFEGKPDAWDFKTMARDTRINKWQWTAAKVEKLMRGYYATKDIKQRSEGAELESGKGLKRARQMDEHDKKRNVFGH